MTDFRGEKKIKTLVVAGPTAVGKTEWSIRLARDLDGEIVSADSMQIYKFMDIGSAKPTPEERSRARHWLVDEIDPAHPFTAADYQVLAKKYIADIAGRGKLPIVSGGTGLYINSLVCEMDFSAPAGDAAYRIALSERLGNDPDLIHRRLEELDPAAAEEIPAANVKRTLRAIERLEGGEKKLAPFSGITSPSKFIDPVMICLDRDRDELYGRIDLRVDKLLSAGLEDEVKGLMAMGFTEDDIAMKGIGYKEIIACLKAGGSAADASEEIKLHTRRYAKRQRTWFRRYPGMKWFTLKGDGFDEETYAEILSYVRGELERITEDDFKELR